MKERFFFLAKLFLIFASLGLSPAQAQMELRPQKTIVWKDFLGVNAHFLWFPEEAQKKQMDRLKELGLEWTRIDLHWDRHEEHENQFNYAPIDTVVNGLKEKQLKSVFYLVGSAPFASSASLLTGFTGNKDQFPPKDSKVFAARMANLAKRYPSVDAWQVWNEPNLPSFWRPYENPKGYLDLLVPTFQALRQVAPQKPVVMAGMAYFSQMPVRKGLMLEELAKMGAIIPDGAIIAYHPYSLTPEGDDPKALDFILRTQQANRELRRMKVPGIWATEWGWSSYKGPKEEQEIIGEKGQADYLLRRLALMSTLDFDKIFLFALSDLDSRASTRDQAYGLLDLKGNPKPSYLALKNFLDITGPKLEPGRAPVLKGHGKEVGFSIAWKKPDGTHLWMFWSLKPGAVSIPNIKSATLYQPLEGKQTQLQKERGEINIPVTQQLQILEWL